MTHTIRGPYSSITWPRLDDEPQVRVLSLEEYHEVLERIASGARYHDGDGTGVRIGGERG